MIAADAQVETYHVLLDHDANVNLQYPVNKQENGGKQHAGRHIPGVANFCHSLNNRIFHFS